MGAKAPFSVLTAAPEVKHWIKYNVRQKLISTILEFGKDVANVIRICIPADTQRKLQESIRDAIQGYTSPYGHTIKRL